MLILSIILTLLIISLLFRPKLNKIRICKFPNGEYYLEYQTRWFWFQPYYRPYLIDAGPCTLIRTFKTVEEAEQFITVNNKTDTTVIKYLTKK